MKITTLKNSVVIVLFVSLVLSACGCCNDGGKRLKLSPIYQTALCGALIGGIVGHQSDEAAAGAALGAAVFGVGELLNQTDRMPHKEKEHKKKDEVVEEVLIQIRNDNGSFTSVVLKKKSSNYIGPNGEYYKELPTAEQLKPVYGL